MSSERTDKRRGLSLLEVMIAASILAGSAMVLSSVIGTGSKFGNRAETRMTAIIQAYSILDESLARIAAGNVFEEYSGETGGPQPKPFRVVVTELADVSNATVSSPSDRKPISQAMLQVEVSLYKESTTATSDGIAPMVRLVQIARRPVAIDEKPSQNETSRRTPPIAPSPNAVWGGAALDSVAGEGQSSRSSSKRVSALPGNLASRSIPDPPSFAGRVKMVVFREN